jgi:hypothetical protein
VKVQPGVRLLSSLPVPELHSHIGLVRTLVPREARVPVNPEE